MLMTKLTVTVSRGLQARNTVLFVSKAYAFKSNVILLKNDASADGKDIMKVMDLHVKDDDIITLAVNGSDEEAAMDALKKSLVISSTADNE
ncbi:HPr family phosphocarrier protein [Terribacillus saccharophilus]|uniref:HPr family phosphocarrier protein n=1 Tax=Terribacillus saccharophilus TaxID=361277 RepID=UPI003981F30D